MVKAMLRTVRIEIAKQDVSARVELMIENLVSISDTLEEQVAELRREVRVKDEKILQLT
jgi:hypothetical protein